MASKRKSRRAHRIFSWVDYGHDEVFTAPDRKPKARGQAPDDLWSYCLGSMLTTNRQVAPWFRQRYQPYRRVISDLYDDICDAKDRPGGTRRLRLLAVALMRRSGWRHPVIDLIGDLADRKVRTADVEAVVEAGVAAGKADTWCLSLIHI